MDHWRQFYVWSHITIGLFSILTGAGLGFCGLRAYVPGFMIMSIWPLISAWHLGRSRLSYLWNEDEEGSRSLLNHLDMIRKLDLMAFTAGVILCLASVSLAKGLIYIGIPLTIVCVASLLVTLKTQWEVGLINRHDD